MNGPTARTDAGSVGPAKKDGADGKRRYFGRRCLPVAIVVAVVFGGAATAAGPPSGAGTARHPQTQNPQGPPPDLYFPPPLVVEPLVPQMRPEDELERDPGGLLVLPNVRANASPGSCFEDDPANACAQNETTIAVNPTNHDNWVGGANDYSGPILLAGRAQSSCGYYVSNDAAQTWEGGLLPTQSGYTGGGDPSIAFDHAGNVYYACLNFELTLPGFAPGASAIFVFKSTNGGQTWSAPTELVSNDVLPGFQDKENIATGAITNNVYVSWVLGGDIHFAGSTDAAATFDAPAPTDNVIVNDAANDSNHGPVLATVGFPNPEGADGEAIYVAWMDLANSRILFDRSTNGGASFGEDIVVEGLVHQFPVRATGSGIGVGNRTTLVGEFGDPAENPNNAFRVNSFPSIAACNDPLSPNFNHVYIVYADNRFGDGDIFFKKSEDGGEHWPGTLTRRVNDDQRGNGKDQFFPSISVDEHCKINISFYDRRDDPQNQRFHLYFTHSTDDGDTFAPNARVTTGASTNAQFFGGFVGDYLQNAATIATNTSFHHDLDRAVALWMDTREGGQDAFAATLLQTRGGTWMNVDADLVADEAASDLHFVFPGDVSGDFSGIYHGPANPFQEHDISYDGSTDETTLSFTDPSPGPIAPGGTAHVGFLLDSTPVVAHTFWTGSGNIGSIPVGSVEFTYDAAAREAAVSICNDREDGRTLAVVAPMYAVTPLPVELADLNETALPAALSDQGEHLAALPPAAGTFAPGQCYTQSIPRSVAPYEAVVLRAAMAFAGGGDRSRAVVFAQRIGKDSRAVTGGAARRYAYTAKLVCGVQPDTRGLALARGSYATTVNVLNPAAMPARLWKTLALARPPGGERAGSVHSVGRELLPAGRALAVDCEDVRQRAFHGEFPASIIDGFVTIESDRHLVVTAVYSAAALNAEATAEDHSSVDVVPVAERAITEAPSGGDLPDLTIDGNTGLDTVCRGHRCTVHIRFTVRNIGPVASGPFSVTVVRSDTGETLASSRVNGGLAAGAARTDTVSGALTLPAGRSVQEICIRADMPANEVTEVDEANNSRCVTSSAPNG